MPWGGHEAWDTMADPRTERALAAFGAVRAREHSVLGGFQAERHRTLSIELDERTSVSVVALRYRSATAGFVRSRVMSPSLNAVAWDHPNRWEPEERAEWRLPGRATLVGLLCDDRRTGCQKWVLWWPRGADVLLLSLDGPVWWTPGSAVVTLRPFWQAVG